MAASSEAQEARPLPRRGPPAPPPSTPVVVDALLLLFHTLGMHFRPAPPLLFTHCCFTCILTACLPHSSMHFSHSISAVILKAFSPSTLVRAHPTYPCTPVDIHALLQSFPTYPCTSVVIHALLQSYMLHAYILHSSLARVPLFLLFRTRMFSIQTSHAFWFVHFRHIRIQASHAAPLGSSMCRRTWAGGKVELRQWKQETQCQKANPRPR